MKSRAPFPFIVVLILIVPALCLAQQELPERLPSDEDAIATRAIGGIIDFLPPGARSLGLGGAFIGLADDATAAESNPAGLTILTRPEVSVHLRNSSFLITSENFFVSEARSTLGDRVSIGDQLATNVNRTLGRERIPQNSGARGALDQSLTSTSFLSVVVPVGRLSLSGYYQETVNLDATGDEAFVWDPLFIDFFHVRQETSAKLRQTGFAGGYKVTDRVSVGGSVRLSELEVRSTSVLRADHFLDFEFDAANSLPPALGQAFIEQFFTDVLFDGSFFTEFVEFEDTREGSDRQLTYNFGVLVQAHENVKVGAVYKRTGTFDIPRTGRATFCFANSPSDPVNATPSSCSEASNVLVSEQVDFEAEQPPPLELPDFLGAGVAAQFMDQSLTVAVDLNIIGYSSLSFVEQPTSIFEPIEDATILRVGAEKVFVLPYDFLNVVSVRGGFFNDPDHDGFRNVDSSENHVTFGLGAVFGGRFQIDFGSEFSESVDNLLVSAIYRF